MCAKFWFSSEVIANKSFSTGADPLSPRPQITRGSSFPRHQNRSLYNSFDAKSKLKIDVSDYPI